MFPEETALQSDAESRQLPRTSVAHTLFTAEIITLIVGGPQSPAQERSPTRFYIHEPILTNNSSFFRAMLSKSSLDRTRNTFKPTWKEAQTNEVRLPEDRVEDWEMMAKWLYSGGSARNRLLLPTVEQSSQDTLLHQLLIWQPGLEDPRIDNAVNAYLEWKAFRNSTSHPGPNNLGRQSQALKLAPTPCEGVSGISGSLAENGNTNSIFSYLDFTSSSHPTITTSESCVPKSPVLAAANPSPDTIIRTVALPSSTLPSKMEFSPRPSPPLLGPLIRLYILADKYDISETEANVLGTNTLTHISQEPQSSTNPQYRSYPPSLSPSQFPRRPCWSSTTQVYTSPLPDYGIKRQIILRIRAINRLANVVPEREDVERLWTCIPNQNDELRGEVLGLYDGLNERCLRRIFGNEGREGGIDWEEGQEWHAGFVRDLLMRKACRVKDGERKDGKSGS